jgi:aryl-alcohol dehydrogenase-like predicted oxidoreductase
MAMERVPYGRTGLMVSRLCFGTGLMSALRHNMTPAEAAVILHRAYELGVTFWDTADGYSTHPHVRAGLAGLDRDRVVVSTKTKADTHAGAAADVERFRQELGLEVIDVVLLHNIETVEELERRQPAFEALLAARERGQVRAVGISTHLGTGAIMEAVAARPEIQVCLTTVNRDGLMLKGDMAAHIALVQRCYDAGTAICLMKTLAQGGLVHDFAAAIRYNMGLSCAHSVCVGINSLSELEEDVAAATPVGVA